MAKTDDGASSKRNSEMRSPKRYVPGLDAVKFSLEERIDLLTQTITEEFFKKVQIAIFDKDKTIIASMLAIRVMQSEGLLEKSLLNFLINGPQSMSSDDKVKISAKTLKTASLNSMIWADL
jgi:hypothetical protein